MSENDIAKIVVDAAYHIHVSLGAGLLESVYERVLAYELAKRGLEVQRQVCLPVRYDGHDFDEAFRIDLLINGLVIVELKSQEEIQPVHRKQLMTYLKLADKRLGLLLNFGKTRMKDGIERIANQMPD
jgi:GxxExxY protein